MEYISFIPLIGGMAIANEQATGKKPKYVLSYDAFAKNENRNINCSKIIFLIMFFF